MKVCNKHGMAQRNGTGMFPREVMKRFPLLPLEEEGRLNDMPLRENFIERAFAYYRWTEMLDTEPTPGGLVKFYTAHKLTLMAHSPKHYTEMGRLVADAGKLDWDELTAEYGAQLMEGLAVVGTRGKHVNVVQHLMGFLKDHICSEEKAYRGRLEFLGQIEDYGRELLPLIVPLTLLKHHLNRHAVPDRVLQQVCLNAYPKELMLRNHVWVQALAKENGCHNHGSTSAKPACLQPTQASVSDKDLDNPPDPTSPKQTNLHQPPGGTGSSLGTCLKLYMQVQCTYGDLTDEQAAHVVRNRLMKTRWLLIGSMAGVALVLTLALVLALNQTVYSPASAPLDTSPDWIATGEGIANNFGYSVGTAGDVNADGYVDVVVGADRYKQFTGRAYVYLGNASGLSATPIFTATGEDVNNHFGYSVGTAGDVNGDGYDDIIVGAYHYKEFTGRVYVYAGNANGLSANPISTITGAMPDIYFGRSVRTAGDVNGDGYDDVIVGAPAYDRWTGRVYVYAGSPGGVGATPIFTASGEGPSNSFGRSAGAAGDVNGDGYSDVVVGAHGYGEFEGRIYVYAGSADGLGAVPTLTVTGEEVNGHFGYSAGTAGDVNRDGYDDLIVGANCRSGNTGWVYVYAGSINGLSATPIFTATGEDEHNYFGYAVSTAGDANGDGYDDVIVGAYHYSASTGRVYVYPGNANGLSITPILSATGEGPASSFGRSVGTAGDVNRKGRSDLVIGACGYDQYTGRAYLYLGEGQ